MNRFDLTDDMNWIWPLVWSVFGCMAVGFLLASVLFFNSNSEAEILKKEAIQNECAQYNPVNGQFEWLKK